MKAKKPEKNKGKEQKNEVNRRLSAIIDKVKGNKPQLEELQELDDLLPPTPTFGGPALEEELRSRRKRGKKSPYL